MTAAKRKSGRSGEGRVAFTVAPELRRRIEAVVAAIRESDDRRRHLAELTEVVVEMTDTGLDFYFLHPLERVGAGRMARGTARVGVAAARRGLPSVVRRVLATLSDDQLLELVEFIDEILVR